MLWCAFQPQLFGKHDVCGDNMGWDWTVFYQQLHASHNNYSSELPRCRRLPHYITTVTDHKRVESIGDYCDRPTFDQFRGMSHMHAISWINPTGQLLQLPQLFLCLLQVRPMCPPQIPAPLPAPIQVPVQPASISNANISLGINDGQQLVHAILYFLVVHFIHVTAQAITNLLHRNTLNLVAKSILLFVHTCNFDFTTKHVKMILVTWTSIMWPHWAVHVLECAGSVTLSARVDVF